MSGTPNYVGVRELRGAFRDFVSTRSDVADLEKSIAERQKSLELRRVELRRLKALIEGHLREMDVASPSNAGWESRYFELLLMMSEVL